MSQITPSIVVPGEAGSERIKVKWNHSAEADLARDRVGWPLIVAQHHMDLRNGYSEFIDFVDWLNAIGNIYCTRLSEIAERLTLAPRASGMKRRSRSNLKNSSALVAAV
jgi:hypothetical protein